MQKQTLWFLAILPPRDIVDAVRALQQEIADRFGPRRALRVPVHITLEPPFRRADTDAGWMCERLNNFFAHEHAFDVELKNFGAFREDVIFIEVAFNLALVELQQRLSVHLRHEPAVIDQAVYRQGYKPHLTLANRDVTAPLHRQIWRELQTKKFFARFTVTAITLLRHDGKKWQSYRDFPLVAGQ